jgi:hypothetical protein
MDRKPKFLLAPAITLALATGAAAGDDTKKDRKDAQHDGTSAGAAQAQQQQQAPDGFILVNERLVYVLANEPQLHMMSALTKLAGNDNRAAAEEVRIAANYVEMQGGRGHGDVSQKLTSSADKLRKLAGKIESGELKDAQKLSKAFAKANVALAQHHNALAKSFLQNDRFVAAGYDLDAAATNLKQAVVWHGEQPQQELVTLLGNADRVAAELTRESIGKQIDDADRAQTAGARQQPDDQPQVGNPIVGTSEAEAKNIAEHARKITDELSTQIDQFASKVGQSQGDSTDKTEDMQDKQK